MTSERIWLKGCQRCRCQRCLLLRPPRVESGHQIRHYSWSKWVGRHGTWLHRSERIPSKWVGRHGSSLLWGKRIRGNCKRVANCRRRRLKCRLVLSRLLLLRLLLLHLLLRLMCLIGTAVIHLSNVV